MTPDKLDLSRRHGLSATSQQNTERGLPWIDI